MNCQPLSKEIIYLVFYKPQVTRIKSEDKILNVFIDSAIKVDIPTKLHLLQEYLKTKKTSNEGMDYQMIQANPDIITVVTLRGTYQLTVER